MHIFFFASFVAVVVVVVQFRRDVHNTVQKEFLKTVWERWGGRVAVTGEKD